MAKEEIYDIVIVGGGPNGVTAAAYLAKCGLSVCVLEERPEAGGACENTEPVPGARINPHAILMYAAPAPGFEQLELWKHGFRMSWNPTMTNLEDMAERFVPTSDGLSPMTEKDLMGWAKISGMLTDPPFIRELLRSIFWCPPHPPEVEVTPENIPFMQVYKQYQPDVWTEELLEMTLFDLMDEYCETEPFKVQQAVISWYSGAAAHWEGVAIPSLGCNITLNVYAHCSTPKGGMHGYFHAIHRAAVANGAVIRTCCSVDEIIINNGRAAGVRLKDSAALGPKKIWANKAIISGVDIFQTFSKLVGPQYLDVSFLQRIKDISLKGGSIYGSHLLTKEKLRRKPQFIEDAPGGEDPGGVYPCDSRELYYEHAADVDGRRGNPSMAKDRVIWIGTPYSRFDPADPQCTIPGHHISSPIYLYVPPPEYHAQGPDAINKVKGEIDDYILKAMSQFVENLEPENIVHQWSNTPYESEFRNTGLVGGTWCGTRHGRDQWWTERPLPELARYRTPVEGLYLCNQTAGHPGGLCLMAIPYNLMHILIEDGIAEPGDWWYPSPWYIPQQGKISAIPKS